MAKPKNKPTDLESLAPGVRNLPQEQRAKLQAYYHSGPLPSPQQLAEYNDIIPDGAERILSMAENQSAHRIRIEAQTVAEQHKQSGKGQFYAFILAAGLIAVGAYAVHAGNSLVANTIFVTTVTSLAGLFLFGRRQMYRNLATKQQGTPP